MSKPKFARGSFVWCLYKGSASSMGQIVDQYFNTMPRETPQGIIHFNGYRYLVFIPDAKKKRFREFWESDLMKYKTM